MKKSKELKHSWNFRVLATKHGNEDVYLKIHEVYYENEKPVSYTSNPIHIGGVTIENLDTDLDMIKICLLKPVIWGDERFPKECNIKL